MHTVRYEPTIYKARNCEALNLEATKRVTLKPLAFLFRIRRALLWKAFLEAAGPEEARLWLGLFIVVGLMEFTGYISL